MRFLDLWVHWLKFNFNWTGSKGSPRSYACPNLWLELFMIGDDCSSKQPNWLYFKRLEIWLLPLSRINGQASKWPGASYESINLKNWWRCDVFKPGSYHSVQNFPSAQKYLLIWTILQPSDVLSNISIWKKSGLLRSFYINLLIKTNILWTASYHNIKNARF